ncbi:MAG TPA: hypothetical protein VFD03_06085 [Clostridia bacterium]|nr:hypothetical protein [Clostridia bacterium]
MMNWDVLYAVGLVFGLFAVLYYLIPYLKAKNLDYYNEIKLALLFFNYAFRDEKLKRIADIALEVVSQIEELSLTPEEKHVEAITRISQELLVQFDILLDDEVLGLIVQIAVTLLPPTHVE